MGTSVKGKHAEDKTNDAPGRTASDSYRKSGMKHLVEESGLDLKWRVTVGYFPLVFIFSGQVSVSGQ